MPAQDSPSIKMLKLCKAGPVGIITIINYVITMNGLMYRYDGHSNKLYEQCERPNILKYFHSACIFSGRLLGGGVSWEYWQRAKYPRYCDGTEQTRLLSLSTAFLHPYSSGLACLASTYQTPARSRMTGTFENINCQLDEMMRPWEHERMFKLKSRLMSIPESHSHQEFHLISRTLQQKLLSHVLWTNSLNIRDPMAC